MIFYGSTRGRFAPRLEGWLEATVSQADSGEVVLDGATRSRLEALGYLQ